jgi:pyruvate dehydrogenase E2 component (dihydrolipoamide acetyltransferase)
MSEVIVVPDIGEGVVSGKVVAVHIKKGDNVAVDDTVIELETDKAVVEIPSTVKGVVVEVLAREGEDLKVGDAIAKLDTQAEAGQQPEAPSDQQSPAVAPMETEEENERTEARVEAAPEEKTEAATLSTGKSSSLTPVPASPTIRRMARELGVDIHDVRGSGPGGRISEADIKAHVREGHRASDQPVAGEAYGEPNLPDFSRWGEVESRDLSTVRRITAQSTTTSWHTVPHVTQFDKADITHLGPFVEKHAKRVGQAGGKLTVTAILTKVCAEALRKFPQFNASIDLNRDRLILKKYIHISMAVDTPRGLLMPVIRNADAKSITELAVAIVDLAERSRNKKIKPTELEGGSFSISNQGGIGGVGFTPIVLWPQVAILGISRSAVEPRMIDGQFQPRTMLPLSLSYDHRIIDGADAARFLRWICDSLEQPMTLYL